MNASATLMAGTQTVAYDRQNLWHLDPYTKMAMGWLEPFVADIRGMGSANLKAPNGLASGTPAVLLWDPTRGPDQYFMLEYRNSALGGYDRAAPGQGMSLWHIALDQSTKLIGISGPLRNGVLNQNEVHTYNWPAGASQTVTVRMLSDNAAELGVAFNGSASEVCHTSVPVDRAFCDSNGCSAALPTSGLRCDVTTPPGGAQLTVRASGHGGASTAYQLRVANVGLDADVYHLSPPWGSYGGGGFWAGGSTSNELHWLDGTGTGAHATIGSLSPGTDLAYVSWAGPGWSEPAASLGMTDISAGIDGQSAVVAGNRLVVFRRGPNGTLEHKYYDTRWSNWIELGSEQITSAPSAVVNGAGRLIVFARGSDGALWHKYYDTQWTSWIRLGGSLSSAPSAVWDGNQLSVFARGPDGAVWRIYYDQKWNGWTQIDPTVIGSAPSAVFANGRLVVFARGTDGILLHTYFDSAWRPWISLGGRITSAPSGVVASGRLVVFGRGAGGELMQKYYQGGWSEWTQIAYEPMQTSPSAVVNSSGRLVVFATISDVPSNIYYAAGWSAWYAI